LGRRQAPNQLGPRVLKVDIIVLPRNDSISSIASAATASGVSGGDRERRTRTSRGSDDEPARDDAASPNEDVGGLADINPGCAIDNSHRLL
jgi:hypothetical protein